MKIWVPGARWWCHLTDSTGKTRHLAVGAGKDAHIYVADRDNMGKFNPANNSNIYQDITGALGGQVFDVLGRLQFEGRSLRELLIEAVRYGERPEVQARLTYAVADAVRRSHLQELLEERIQLMERLHAREKLAATETELSKNIYERGVDNKGFANIRSKGDWALFGGNNTSAMKRKLGIAENRPLADFLPTITISAKQSANNLSPAASGATNLISSIPITSSFLASFLIIRTYCIASGIFGPSTIPSGCSAFLLIDTTSVSFIGETSLN